MTQPPMKPEDIEEQETHEPEDGDFPLPEKGFGCDINQCEACQ